MAKGNNGRLSLAAMDELIEEITTDAYGEGEQLWAFRQAFEDNVTVPCAGFLAGEPFSVMKFDFDGNERRGLTVKCRCADGTKHVVAAADVAMLRGSEGAPYIAAYRKWMGLAPYPPAAPRMRGELESGGAKATRATRRRRTRSGSTRA